jgi:hypothetical protein
MSEGGKKKHILEEQNISSNKTTSLNETESITWLVISVKAE